MPVTFDLSKSKWFAEYGEQERLKGMEAGIKKVVRLQLEKRFGILPASITKRLARMSDAQAQELALAIIDAKSLRELFGTYRQ